VIFLKLQTFEHPLDLGKKRKKKKKKNNNNNNKEECSERF